MDKRYKKQISPRKILRHNKQTNRFFATHKQLPVAYVFIFFLWFSIFNIINAQSFFSMRGFGEEILCTDAYANSLGGIISISRENPAQPIVLNKTNFYASLSNNIVFGKENNWQRTLYDFRPIMVEGKVPLPKRFRIGLKLAESFNQNFNIYSESIPIAGYWAQRHIIGQGGIYRITLNSAKTFTKPNLSLGIDYSYLIGQEIEHWIFEIAAGNYITRDTIITNYSAQSLRFGILSDWSFLTVGFHIEDILPGTIKDHTKSHGTSAETTFMFNLPYALGCGLSYNKLQNTDFYIDFLYKNWRKAQIKENYVSTFQNSMKYSFGVEHWLSANHPLRLGLKYYQSYLLDHTNYQIKEYGLTCGSSILIPKFGGFDYSLELFLRQGKKVKETIVRLNLSLSYEETWKKRTRRWGS
ncbi:MAG: hypothetical protein N2201_03250 [candidate division WOR-3 bacterium]|nr:hypothetical protein [candidate division WOR-3 bacterium]